MSEKLDPKALEELLYKIIGVLKKNGMIPENANAHQIVDEMTTAIDKAGGLKAGEKDSKEMHKILSRAIIHTATKMNEPGFSENLKEFMELSLQNARPEEKQKMSPEELKRLQQMNNEIDEDVLLQVQRVEAKLENAETEELEASPEMKKGFGMELKFKQVVDAEGDVIMNEGTLGSGDDNFISIEAIAATEGEEPIEDALEDMGFIPKEKGLLDQIAEAANDVEETLYKSPSPLSMKMDPNKK